MLTAVLVGACFTVGQGIVAVCGWRRWTWWAPAVGYGALMILAAQIIRFPAHPRALIALAVAAALGAFVFPLVRASARESLPDAVPVGLGLLLLAAVPFFAAGHTGVLGASVSNDMSQHLVAAYWLEGHHGLLPYAAIGGDLITTGYPLGPHALAAELSRASGLGEERAFSAVTLAVPVLTGFAALGLVPTARRGARWALAAVVGLGYLPAAYLGQGSFKETIQAMLALATAVALADLAREPRIGWRRGIPIGLMVAAAIYNYSYGGVIWSAGIVFMFLAAEVIRRRELFSVMRRWSSAGVGTVIALVATVAPEWHRIQLFKKSLFGAEALHNKGNLSHPLNPLESLGVWFNGDFRFNPDPSWPTLVFCALALAALAAGLPWWWRRRAFALPAAVIAAIVIWVNLSLTVNIYNAAKGLVVLSPLVMAAVGAPLAAAWSVRARTPRARLAIRLARVVSVVLLGGAVVASAGALRWAPVGLGSHEQELAAMRPLVKDKAVLFVENDHFAQWELRGANPLYTTYALYAPMHLGMTRFKVGGLPIDIDNYGKNELNKLDYIVTAGGAYQSEIPPNFHLAMHTPSYNLYRRVGRTPTRVPIEAPGDPGTILDCNSARGKDYLAQYRWAGVLPRPVVLANWRGSIARPGRTAQIDVKLPRGRWDVSLQYLSQTPVAVRGPALQKTLAANFGLITNYWPAGTLTSDGRSFTLSVSSGKRSSFGRLLGTPPPTRAPLSPFYSPLFHVAFTRHDVTPRRVPISAACGRYVDWLAPGGSKMRGRSGHGG